MHEEELLVEIGGRKTFVIAFFIAFLMLSITDIPQNDEAHHSVQMPDLRFSQMPITKPFGDAGEGTYDLDPPEISDVLHIPKYPKNSETIEVRVRVTDPSGVVVPVIFMHCMYPSEVCAPPMDMTPLGGNVHNIEIGPFSQNEQYVDYYFLVEDGLGNSGQSGLHWIYMPNFMEVGMNVNPTSTYTMNSVWVNGSAIYGFKNATIRKINSTAPAAFSAVNVSIKGTGVYRLGMTDLNGNYSLRITMPPSPGNRMMNVSLSNRSIYGWNETTINIQQLKILHSPQLSKTVMYPDNTIWVNGTATYNNGSKAIGSNVSVRIDGQEWHGSTNSAGHYSVLVTSPSVAGSYDVSVTASNQTVLVTNTTVLSILVTDVPVPDLSLTADDITISDTRPIVNRDFSIDVRIHNTGSLDALDFYVEVRIDGVLEHQEYVASLAQGTYHSFDFLWSTMNGRNITIIVFSDPLNTLAEAVENNNNASKTVYVDGDFDGDGVGDTLDDDDDNDGHPDDGDEFPYDPTEWMDTDKDGMGDNKDIDDDGDGYPDWRDRFPLDDGDWEDTDNDGLGNNNDDDDDNDGIIDILDEFPLNHLEWMDSDGDGVGDNMDLDDDNDGMPDLWEESNGLYPTNSEDAVLDHDGDGLTNLEEYELGTSPKDKDTDDDGIWDSKDYAPINAKVKLSPRDQALETIILMVLAATVVGIVLILLMLTTRRNNEK
jgi:hypothetical protein